MTWAPPRRLAAFGCFVGAWCVVVAARSTQVSIFRSEEYRRRAEKQQEREVTYRPKRGEILDREGRELAISVEAASVVVFPAELDSRAEAAGRIAPLLGIDPLRLLDRFREGRQLVTVARGVDFDVAEKIRAFELDGVHVVPDTKRVYPKGRLASQVLGFIGVDNEGLAGLEYQYDTEVRGRPGSISLLRDARRSGGVKFWKSMVREQPVPGGALRLTLDASLQYVVERELDDGARRAHAKSASAVVLDPRDGSVRALASWPPFDPQAPRRGNDPEAWRLRPVQNAYEPGSTFKVVPVAAALARGVMTADDPVDCGGGTIVVAGHAIHEIQSKAYGLLPLREALAHSSNVGLVRVGLALGREPLFEAARAFGFGERTGVDLPGENPGILRRPEAWSAVSLASLSIGQEISVTPLQLAAAYGAIANGGTLYRPRLVEEVLAPDGSVARKIPPTAVRLVIDPTIAAKMRELLGEVVDDGTGGEARVAGYGVCGKTGTAQKAGPGGYLASRYIASFAGFTPASDPRFVILVILDEPQGEFYGGKVAAPIFRHIAEWALQHERLPPQASATDRHLLAAMRPLGPSSPQLERPQGLLPARARAGAAALPDLAGLDLRRATAQLSALGIVPRVLGHGRVARQSPAPGTPIEAGQTLTLVMDAS